MSESTSKFSAQEKEQLLHDFDSHFGYSPFFENASEQQHETDEYYELLQLSVKNNNTDKLGHYFYGDLKEGELA